MMNEIDLNHLDLNLLVSFDVLMYERNVTRVAKRLARSQSGVSHSWARLREQPGDPWLVNTGGRMTPTPFGVKLAEDVRPILRVIAPPPAFDPTPSERMIRLALPAATSAIMPV